MTKFFLFFFLSLFLLNLSAQNQENDPNSQLGIQLDVQIFAQEHSSGFLSFPGPNEWEKITQQNESRNTQTSNEISLQIFDVRDLIEGENFVPPVTTVEALTQRIQSEIAPDSWNSPDYHFEIKNKSLLVKHTKKTHQEINDLLLNLRRKGVILFHNKFKTVSANNPDLAEIMKNSKNRVLAPKIITLDQQKFEISCLEQTSYIEKYILNRRNGTEIVDPVINIINNGFTLSGTIKIENVSEGTLLFQDISILINELQKPIEDQKTEFGTLQIPKTCSWEIKLSNEILNISETLVIGPIAQTWKDSSLYFVISAKIVPIPQDSK